jgi:NNP family nitrate/nitrite transporter-like MFS transporter
VAQYYPKNTGLVTGIVGCAGGLGGFFPPLVLGYVKDATQTYALGFVFLAIVAVICLGVLIVLHRQQATPTANTKRASRTTT